MKKILFLNHVVFFHHLAIKSPSANDNSVEDKINLYIKKFAPAAVKNMRFYRIPASITLAQESLNQVMSEGTLAKKQTIILEIKCLKRWKSKSITHDDDEKMSVLDHIRIH